MHPQYCLQRKKIRFSGARTLAESTITKFFVDERDLIDKISKEVDQHLGMFLTSNEQHKKKSDKEFLSALTNRSKIINKMQEEKDAILKELNILKDLVSQRKNMMDSHPKALDLDQKISKLRLTLSSRAAKYETLCRVSGPKTMIYLF